MKINNKKFPIIIIAIGLLLVVLSYTLTTAIKTPVITEHDFNYSFTYKLNGETKTVNGVYRCEFTDEYRDPTTRYYNGTHLDKEWSFPDGAYKIDEKDGYELCITVILDENELMGDGNRFSQSYIYLVAYDSMGCEYTDPEILGLFDAELVSYELPEPIDNSFVFDGFSYMRDLNMGIMLLIGIFTIIACGIFVKRDEGVVYKALDKVSIAINFVIGFLVIPIVLLIVWISQIYMSEDEFIFQLNLCIPAISAFAIAASMCLRRKGYRKSGFFVQFIGPVLYAISLSLELIIWGVLF